MTTPPGDAPQPKPRKRMLPAVSDVVQELGKISTASPEILFKVARQVCAEELNRVKQGLESAPLDVIVRRAHRILHPEAHVVSAPPSPASVRAADAEDPFNETTGALDLKPLWAKQKGDVLGEVIPPPESFALAPAPEPLPAVVSEPAPVVPDSPPPAPEPTTEPVTDEAFRVAAHEEPLMHGTTFELEHEPDPGPVPEPERMTEILPMHGVVSPQEPEPPSSEETEEEQEERPGEARPPAHVTTLQGEGPGEQTLTRLEKEAGSVDLAAAISRGLEATPCPESEEEQPRPRVEVEPQTRPRFTVPGAHTSDHNRGGRIFLAMIGILILVGGGLFAWVRFGGGTVPAPLAPLVRKRPASPPPSAPPQAVVPIPAPAAAPTAVPTPTQATAPPPAEVVRMVPPTPKKPAPHPVTPRVEPTLAPPPKEASAPAPSTSTARSAASPQSRAATLATKDWSGKEPVFVIHFSSYQSREKAEKDAERLAKQFGKAGRAVEVDLGPKGLWYRSVIGDFATVEEAFTFRADLEAKNTPNMGFVYRLVGKS